MRIIWKGLILTIQQLWLNGTLISKVKVYKLYLAVDDTTDMRMSFGTLTIQVAPIWYTKIACLTFGAELSIWEVGTR